MATITPTITVGTPALQVSTGPIGPPYSAILEALNGSWAFVINEIYYRPENFNQFANPLGYTWFEINANFSGQMVATFVDPMDYLPVQYVKTKGREMSFEGQSILTMTLLPAETVQLFLIGDEMYAVNALNAINRNNFEVLKSAMGKPDLFKDYASEI